MYVYDEYDQRIIEDRVKQFRDQTRRYLAGELSEEEFRPLRLQNGLYIQRFAPMLRVAVPYGQLNARQVRTLAKIARDYDKGYAHISTRQNVQYNWPALEDIPDILAELATVQMHAIQTSGNCLRNTTTDQFAGVAADELIDPRPWCEIVRQWTTFHPEFAYLPRKFKIAINGSKEDRAAIEVHDIGLEPVRNEAGELGFRVLVGGGLGRTPVVGSFINEFLPWQDLISYLDAILRVYNRYGRRDNKYKARIKILVKALTPEVFAEKVEAEMVHLRGGSSTLTEDEVQRVSRHFVDPDYLALDNVDYSALDAEYPGFARWRSRNTRAHKRPGYVAVTLSLKPTGVAPGDLTDKQLDAVADLAERYSFGFLRTSHEQNIILADVEQRQLHALWQELREGGFATPNIGLLTDIICCPGGDYCSLANAKSIPIAESIQRRFDDLDYLFDIGEIDLNISGCMNACGHHHVGHIGILGVDKKGEEFYQVSLGGNAARDASLGKILGPSFAQDAMADVIEKLIAVYVEQRTEEERFIDTYQRIGIDPFKERVYAANH
ncbi:MULTISPECIES: nitrite/sulfite reductase [Pseudomonas]|jgi:sulfite reductase (NADPH) hemoprotein beta-component|uniref:Nitrite/sulfite reductase n=1 Tax=Pseudomonas capeferrum TaxID=1495066 RepID=A0ABY7R5P7_9PSED|nr:MULTISPECIES: nitrite/sulfite reductase [Pseudomonas]KGI95323.1 sulfite reductase [Pseudomonas sp. H2]MBC3480429.1 nitrite/sulfite reductase [Pseudomonas sp. SWRI77]MUT51757.1 nitrite/sulfite reductase [Pseudomonas sp. TDA1]UPL07815.1 Sulfite reductase ferredoxin [Pseudomonas sp. IsoF]UVL02214.1 nitrite/sulfite reductase [Pseudomonas sp. B21-047]